MAGYIGNKAVNLSTSGADIGGTANLDAVDIDGAVNMATTALVTGVLTTTAAAVFNGGFTSNGDTATFTSANSEDPLVILKNTTNDANSARLRFVKDRGAAGVDGDDSGEIEFYADNDAQQQTLFARIKGEVQDASDGAEGGRFKFQVASHDGEIITALSLSDGSAEDEVDVTIGSGTSSVTSIAGTLTSTGVVTANAGVVVDTMTLDAATLTATGDFTVDSAGDIVLDAAGEDIKFFVGGSAKGRFTHSSGDFVIQADTQDKDMIFKGDDGGTSITALTLDMSDAGSAYFNNKVGVNTTSPTGYHHVNGNSAVNTIGYNLTWGGVGGGQTGEVYGMKLAAQSNNNGGDTYGVFSQAAQGVGGNSCGVYGDNNINSLTQNSGARSIGVWGKCVDNSGANGNSPYTANATIKAGVLGLVTSINSSANSQNAAVVANNQSATGAICYGVAIHTTAGPNAIRGLEYDHNGTVVLNIASTGNVTNTNNSYGAISDLKLKENISAASSQWDDIKAVQVKNYSLKTDELDAANRIGVIAQDLEASGMGGLVEDDVVAITKEDGSLDPTQTETTKQVKYSVLYMKAVKALQEAMTRIEALETKVTALENA